MIGNVYHHVLRRTAAREGGKPVYVRLRPTDRWMPSAPDRYRVVGTPISLGSHFCFVALDGSRMCTVGKKHEHTSEMQPPFARNWSPTEIAP